MQEDIKEEARKRMLARKKRRIRRKIVRVSTGITALALTCSLAIHKYNDKKSDRFDFYPDRSGNMIVNKHSYINHEYLDKYYVIELYHTELDRSIIFIASRFEYNSGNSKYNNIFNNEFIAYDNNEKDFYEFMNVTPLSVILEEYGLEQEKYYYNEMLDIYNTLKNNYEFADTSIYQKDIEETPKVKKRTLN